MEGSGIRESHRHGDVRVQDPYSVRCAPQVHGAVRDVLTEVDAKLAIEMNSVTDNPLIFPDEMSTFLGQLAKSKSGLAKLRTLLRVRPRMFKPIIALMRGLTDLTGFSSTGAGSNRHQMRRLPASGSGATASLPVRRESSSAGAKRKRQPC